MRHLTLLWLVCVLGASASSCAILAPGEGHGGGVATLSDATSYASRDTSRRYKETPLDVGHETPPVLDPEPVATNLAPGLSGPPTPHTPSENELLQKHLLFGLLGGAGMLGGTDYDHYETIALTLGAFVQPHVRVDGVLGVSGVMLRGETKLGSALSEPMDLSADVTARYYFTEPYTLMGVYGIATAGTGTLFWDYAHQVPIVQDGVEKMVGDDHINHFDFSVGLGMSLLQLSRLHVGGNLTGGVRFYGWHTYQGFENNMLPTTGIARFQIEMQYRK